MASKKRKLFYATLITAVEAIILSYELSVLFSPEERYDQTLSPLLFVPLFLLPFPLFFKNWVTVLSLSIVISIFEISTSIAIWTKSHIWVTFFPSILFGTLGIFVKYTVRTSDIMDESSYYGEGGNDDEDEDEDNDNEEGEIRNLNNKGRGIVVEIDKGKDEEDDVKPIGHLATMNVKDMGKIN